MAALKLTPDDLELVLGLADQQIQLMDDLEGALTSGDVERVIEIARRLVRLEHEIAQEPPQAA